MRKIAAVAMLFVLLLAGCGGGGSAARTRTVSSPEQEAIQRKEMEIAELHSENRLFCVIAKEVKEGRREGTYYPEIGKKCRSYRVHHRRMVETLSR